MFNVVLDSNKHINMPRDRNGNYNPAPALQPSITNRTFGYDFGTQEEGEYKINFAISTYGFITDEGGVALPSFGDVYEVHINIGSPLNNYLASENIDSKSSNLLGFTQYSTNHASRYTDNPSIKLKLNNTATTINVQLKKIDGTALPYNFSYKMILTFEKCSCSH